MARKSEAPRKTISARIPADSHAKFEVYLERHATDVTTFVNNAIEEALGKKPEQPLESVLAKELSPIKQALSTLESACAESGTTNELRATLQELRATVAELSSRIERTSAETVKATDQLSRDMARLSQSLNAFHQVGRSDIRNVFRAILLNPKFIPHGDKQLSPHQVDALLSQIFSKGE